MAGISQINLPNDLIFDLFNLFNLIFNLLHFYQVRILEN